MFSGEIGLYRAGLRSTPEGGPIVASELRAEPDEVWFREEQPLAARGVQAAHSGRHRPASKERLSYREVFAIGEFRAWTRRRSLCPHSSS